MNTSSFVMRTVRNHLVIGKNWFLAACFLGFVTSSTWTAEKEAPQPLPRAHSHNDYEHARPLLDALDQGFCSVEADIYLVDGQLLVAHDRDKVSPQRTLEKLYLDPLQERVRMNDGRVYKGGPTVILLIDIKSEAEPTYKALHEVLGSYSTMLTRFAKERIETNAVTVVISGNRPRALMESQPVRYAGMDGRPPDLDLPPDRLIPLVSEDWKRLFTWRGVGPFPNSERDRLRDIVRRAHQHGRKIRFWGAPDRPEIWGLLLENEVDLINTDNLVGLRRFLEGTPAGAQR